MKKSIKNLICVASMASVIAASFCTVSATTVTYYLLNNGSNPSQTNYLGNVNAVVGETPTCEGSATGVDIRIYGGNTYVGLIRPRMNESTKSYIQNINNCRTTTTLVSSSFGSWSKGNITTAP